MVYHEEFTVDSGIRVTFFDVTDRVMEIVRRSGIRERFRLRLRKQWRRNRLRVRRQ